ncbi:class I SAM-dependent methyltransferase [Bradyrhizobium archetypum]|uniref:Class I SAM-dependent methyltransferase n=1 Tax=Bradyrhizobium archetypum TaxID=2721160 RepID=A0A7Y4H2L3_9BRAD|nr:class I SAM-dependent methyltransferase [Bradyrhizobium archetypum]
MSDGIISEELWAQFAEQRLEEGNLNDHLDLPTIFRILGDAGGGAALDLGCGLGQSSFKLAEMLNYSVVAVDGSSEMLDRARNLYSGSRITWLESTFENLSFNDQSFDLIVSCLSFHFVCDLQPLIRNCASWLKRGGLLVFSVRHPIRTCNPVGELTTDQEFGWSVNEYANEGLRTFKWLGLDCVNFHRTVSTYIRFLRNAGLRLEALEEPISADETRSFAAESRSVPFFLTIAARKID